MNHSPRRVFCVLPLLLLVLACVPAPAASLFQDGLEDPASGAVDWLSDEFDNPASLSDFQRAWRREHWPFDQLQLQVIGLVPGRLTMQPHSSGWYEDYRGELTYKELSGDVVATTLVYPRNAASTGWQVLRRFHRSDFPERLQLGFVTYTDWATMQNCSYEFHNHNLLAQSCGPSPQPADPDLNASFEFLRVARPQVPAPFVGADFSNPAAVSDAQLLALFGFAP